MADEQGVLLAESTADRVIAVTRRVEADPRFSLGVPAGDPGARSPVQQWVQITSVTQTSGRYPGVWYLYDPVAKSWAAQPAAIWVVVPNTEILATGKRYFARAGGEADGRMVFVALKDAGTSGGAALFSGARAKRLTAQTIGDGSQTPITFTAEVYDSGSYFTASDDAFEAEEGYYHAGGWVRWTPDPAGVGLRSVYVDNGEILIPGYVEDQAAVDFAHAQHVSCDFYQSATGDVKLFAYQTSGGDLDVEEAHFWIHRIGA